MTQKQINFIDRIGKIAAVDMTASGVLASLTVAQAILESGWGTSPLAVKGLALFGIKATGAWKGRVFNKVTQECYDGVNFTNVGASFRAYGSWGESIADRSAFLRANARYAAVIWETDYIKACRAVQVAGYATDPGYADKLIRLIEQYGLNKFDSAQSVQGGRGKMIITLDPGHGDKGNAYPAAPGFFEGTQMWKLSQFLGAELELRGFEVANTRPKISDCPLLAKRGGTAAENGSVMFYSLHSNAPGSPTQTAVTGSEVFIHKSAEKHRPLAEALLAAVCNAMGHKSRGVKVETGLGVIRAAVSRGLNCAMLMEHGFHTNPKDAAFLSNDDCLKKLAVAQADVLAAYFGVAEGAAPPVPAPPVVPFKEYRVRIDRGTAYRVGPSASSAVAGSVPDNGVYTIVEVSGSWGKLKSGAGWVALGSCSKI